MISNKLVLTARKGVAVGFGLGASLVAGFAQAAMDTATVTTAITEAATAVGVIGAAVLVVVVGIKAYKWVARAL